MEYLKTAVQLCRCLLLWPVALVVPAHAAEIASGETQSGQLTANAVVEYTFGAQEGQQVILRAGTTTFVPRVQLLGPGLVLLGTGANNSTVSRDAELMLQVTNSGTFTVRLDSLYSGGAGDYGLRLALAPASFTVPADDEGGALDNGARHSGTVERGDIDLWSFDAAAGDGVQLRLGATGFVPRLRVFEPNGVLVYDAYTSSTVNRDASAVFHATNSGTYLVVGSSLYVNGDGDYELSYVRAPGSITVAAGDEGGPLTNAVTRAGTINLGELDAWTFNATVGQSIQVRIGAVGFVPRLDLYGPDGALVISAFTGSTVNRDARLALQVTNSGVFTLVASSLYFNGTGEYLLSFARVPDEVPVVPGDDGGALTNGWTHEGTIEVGDLDSWTFSAQNGSSIELRVGSPDLVPQIDLYSPNGALIHSAWTGSTVNRDAHLAITVTNSGTFTAVISGLYANDSGFYILTLAHSGSPVVATPGDSGGSLTNGLTYAGTNVLGDLEVWQFHGTVGDSNVFRIGTSGYTPRLRLYGPQGHVLGDAYVGSTVNRTNFLVYVVTNEGPHTIVASSLYANGSGTYSFKQSRLPPDLMMPGFVSVDEGSLLSIPIYANDPDAPANTLIFQLVSGPPGAQVITQGPTNAVIQWQTSENDGPGTNSISASVTDVVNGRPFIRTNSMAVVINEVNTAPSIASVAPQTTPELSPFTFTVEAQDADVPANALSFSLDSAPEGMVIDPDTGVIQWTPGELDGPATNQIVVVVTDDNPWAVNNRNLSATNSFVLVVREVNTPPQIQPVPLQQTDELAPFAFSVVATDADQPPNILTFQVVDPPAGLNINPGTGAITWTATEAQGPSTNRVIVLVRDQSPTADQPELWATNSFEIIVREVNTPPSIQTASRQETDELAPFSFNVIGSDPDVPANLLSYELIAAPPGLTIDAHTGAMSWTPEETQGPSTNLITVTVKDQNLSAAQPELRATNTFEVVVREVNSPPVLPNRDPQSIRYGSLLSFTPLFEDSDVPANSVSFELISGPTNLTVEPTAGLISWVPAPGQLGTNIIVLRAIDDGVPALSTTNAFQVWVTGVEPSLTIQLLPGGLMQVSISGDTGLVYDLEHSADLETWQSLVRLNVPSSPYPYIDPGSVGPERRYYRARVVP